MKKKSEITTEYILKIAAPVFNKKGYFGTSMQDITTATGLTKGAIYGNFLNKEDLATKAFVYNVKILSENIGNIFFNEKISYNKLYALSGFYKNYYEFSQQHGGCPILNIGVDSNHQNPKLIEKVKKTIKNMQNAIAEVIEEGIQKKEMNTVDSVQYARKFFGLIEGGIFMTTIMDNPIYMNDICEMINSIIKNELIATVKK